jgi:signal transduction histidine kinase
VVERAVGRHAPIARQRTVKLDRALPQAPLWVRGDVTLIEQAVSNVIHNAVRYNRENGHVAVLLERVDHERFVLRVIDDGPGIPDHELSKLVERHFRGNAARSREPGGRGLGLTIAFRVAQVHGWQLRLVKAKCGGLQVELDGTTSDEPSQLQRAARSV